MSDWVTWEVCPRCGLTAAVGWIGAEPVEVDCTKGCELTAAEVGAFADRQRSVLHPSSGR